MPKPRRARNRQQVTTKARYRQEQINDADGMIKEGVQRLGTEMFHPDGPYGWLVRLRRKLKGEAKRMDLEVLADIGFLLRTMEDRYDVVRKQSRAVRLIVDRVLAIRILKAGANAVGGNKKPGNVLGKLCNARIYQGVNSKLPDKNSKQYHQFMEWLGIAEEHRPLVRIHWPSLAKLVTQSLSEGGQLPAGLDDRTLYEIPEVSYRTRPGLDLDQLAEYLVQQSLEHTEQEDYDGKDYSNDEDEE